MDTLYLIFGTIFLLMQAMTYWMLTAFSGKMNGAGQFGFWGLPTICIIAIILMFFAYFNEWNYVYVWTLFPLAVAILFFIIK